MLTFKRSFHRTSKPAPEVVREIAPGDMVVFATNQQSSAPQQVGRVVQTGDGEVLVAWWYVGFKSDCRTREAREAAEWKARADVRLYQKANAPAIASAS